jgi:two-component system, chemotaxis family, response regulator Rcp1
MKYGDEKMRSKDILLVEDTPGDVRLAREAIRDAKVRTNLHVVGDGVEAMAFLRREGKYADATRPDLIMLDLTMPKKNGFEVLAEIKADAGLKKIPVIIFSVSKSEGDIRHAYDLQANCYIGKPADLNGLIVVIKAIDDFWLTAATLPEK